MSNKYKVDDRTGKKFHISADFVECDGSIVYFFKENFDKLDELGVVNELVAFFCQPNSVRKVNKSEKKAVKNDINKK